MIWICTLCLLLVAAWLFFNALNERRWVQAHSHDEAVASDEGLFPVFSARTGSGSLGADGKISIDQENSRFARSVQKVQATSKKYGDKFFESKVAEAKITDPEQRPGSAAEENTLFGRSVARVMEKTRRMDKNLKAKVKHFSGQSNLGLSGDDEDASPLERAARKVVSKSGDITQKVTDRARNIAQGFDDGHSPTDEGGVFSRATAAASKMANLRNSQASAAKNNDQDLMSRVADKVGSKISELDEKIVSTSKNVSNKFDDKFVDASKKISNQIDKT